MRSLYTAATGMAAQQLRIDNIANNLANVNTAGFKAQRAEFEDLYYQKVRSGSGRTAAGTGRNDGIEIGHGTRTAALRRDFSTGGIVETGNAGDMAIRGEGFFSVQSAEGELFYTRVGSFGVDANGNLVTPSGLPLDPGVVVPDGATIEVKDDGLVLATVPGQEPQELGQIQLSRFMNPAGLEALGAGMYRETQGSGSAVLGNPGSLGFGTILGGALESSNVDVAKELIDMVMAQRSYELTSKVITTTDEMLQTTNQLKR